MPATRNGGCEHPPHSMSTYRRYCCKSRKLQGDELFAKLRNGKQSPNSYSLTRISEVAREFHVGR